MILIKETKHMLLRVLIFLFAFNAIIPSAFAVGIASPCGMEMNHSMSTNAEQDTAFSLPKFTCPMMEMGETCHSAQCASQCMVTVSSTAVISQLDEPVILLPVSTSQPHYKVVHYHQIVLPIQTPPPLV